MKQPQQPDPFADQADALYNAVFSREPSVLERYHRLEAHSQPSGWRYVKAASNRLAGVGQAALTLGRWLRIQRLLRVRTQRRKAKRLNIFLKIFAWGLACLAWFLGLNLALPSVGNSVASFLVKGLTPDAWVEDFYAKQQCAVRLPVVDASGQLLDVTDSVCGLPSADKPHFITAPMTQAEAL